MRVSMSENDQEIIVTDSNGNETLTIRIKDGDAIATMRTKNPERQYVIGGFEIETGADVLTKAHDYRTHAHLC